MLALSRPHDRFFLRLEGAKDEVGLMLHHKVLDSRFLVACVDVNVSASLILPVTS